MGSRREAPEAEEVRILLVVKEDVLRRGIRQVLLCDPLIHIVAELDFGADPGERAEGLNPSCVLVGSLKAEVMIQEIGVCARHFRRRILAAGYGGAREAVMAVAAGASGFMDAGGEPAELLRAVRAVAAGGVFLDPSALGCLIEEFWRISQVVSEVAPAIEMLAPDRLVLTSREEEVAQLLARGYSNREIASRLSVSEKTVKNHVSSILRKLGLPGRSRVAAWEIGRGLLGLKA